VFKVEKNIPIWPLNRKRDGELIKLIEGLEIGDSFECSYVQCERAREAGRLRSIKLVSRKIGNDKQRVWRIA
jgi:hypothetical protein